MLKVVPELHTMKRMSEFSLRCHGYDYAYGHSASSASTPCIPWIDAMHIYGHSAWFTLTPCIPWIDAMHIYGHSAWFALTPCIPWIDAMSMDTMHHHVYRHLTLGPVHARYPPSLSLSLPLSTPHLGSSPKPLRNHACTCTHTPQCLSMSPSAWDHRKHTPPHRNHACTCTHTPTPHTPVMHAPMCALWVVMRTRDIYGGGV